MRPDALSWQPVQATADHWDAFLTRQEGAQVLQAYQMGPCLAQPGERVDYWQACSGAEVIAQCQILTTPEGWARWHQGPVMSESARNQAAPLTEALLRALRDQGVVAVEYASTPVAYDGAEPGGLTGRGWSPSVTPLMLLAQPWERLWAAFHPSVRKNLRKCEAAGLEVIFSDAAPALARYEALVVAHRRELGLPLPVLYPTASRLSHCGLQGLRWEVALAACGSRCLAGLGFARLGDTVIEVGVGQAAGYASAGVPAHDAIKVAAARRYQALGLRFYDLAGISLQAQTDKERGISRFKMKFAQRTAAAAVLRQRVLAPARYWSARLRRHGGALARLGSRSAAVR